MVLKHKGDPVTFSPKEQLIKDLQIGCGGPRPIKAPSGNTLHCKGWHQEAALCMLCNNLDPSNGGNPDELIVYAGIGKAARNWDLGRLPECTDQYGRRKGRKLQN